MIFFFVGRGVANIADLGGRAEALTPDHHDAFFRDLTPDHHNAFFFLGGLIERCVGLDCWGLVFFV